MKRILLAGLMALAAIPVIQAEEFDGNIEKINVFKQGDDGSKFYRIPAITQTNDGTIVAIADRRGNTNSDLPEIISVVCKRSTDMGQTWSDAIMIAEGDFSTKTNNYNQKETTFGDPAVAYDPDTNTIVCVFSGDKGFWWGSNRSRNGFYVSTSTDNGLTWTTPRNFANEIYQPAWDGAFAASGSMCRISEGEHKGRIMFVANVNTYFNYGAGDITKVKEYLCYTDDLGATWHCATTTPPATEAGNESKVVMLDDGRLLMSIRTRGARVFTTSSDMGETWSQPVTKKQLVEPDCNGDIIRYIDKNGKKYLLHSIPYNPYQRRDVSVFVSEDEGETWPVKKFINEGSSAYSAMTVLNNGWIGMFIEDGTQRTDGGYNLVFCKFPFEWLIGGSSIDATEVTDSNAVCERYSIDGKRLADNSRHEGIVIVREGKNTRKVINR